jgi:hypothetical protein
MNYRLRLYPYSGGFWDLIGEGTRQDCRDRVARRIWFHRNTLEYPVTILERGRSWELESDPNGRCLISAGEGILAIEEIVEADDSWTQDDEPFEVLEDGEAEGGDDA